MEVFAGLQAFVPAAGGVVLTIGNFDGVHRGHAGIVAAARQVAARLRVPVVALTFDPHPLAVLAPERTPPILTTLPERLALLERCGVDACIVQRSEPALLALPAEDFLASLVAHVRPRALVEGPDFRFGRGRGGSNQTLRQHAAAWGYEVHEVPAVHCGELPTHPTIRSSSIRQALLEGRIAEANAMLGRPYRLVGVTGGGAGRGARLGFPTANLERIPHLLPQEAVYAAAAQLADGRLHLAAVNIGPQPTFGQERSRVEAHLLDYRDGLRGTRLGLHFFARLREQVKFAGPEELAAQVQRDVVATRARAAELEALRRAGPIPL